MFWYVFYTAPRAEKVVCKNLVGKNYNVFLPTTKILREWKNRQKKWIEQVLFPSYIFVNTEEYELYNIVRIPKIAAFIKCGSKPSTIPVKDIEAIKKMISLDKEVSVEHNFIVGESVRINKGPLMGYEGILVKQKGGTKFGIQLKDINHTVLINVCTSLIEKIK